MELGTGGEVSEGQATLAFPVMALCAETHSSSIFWCFLQALKTN